MPALLWAADRQGPHGAPSSRAGLATAAEPGPERPALAFVSGPRPTIAAAALRASGRVVIDCRSPDEFADGHVPGAVSAHAVGGAARPTCPRSRADAQVNWPLFSTDERRRVGALYREGGKDAAVDLGAARRAAALRP
jgi:rhodanese-related sulfurtransferase